MNDDIYQWEAIYTFGNEKPVAWIRVDSVGHREYVEYHQWKSDLKRAVTFMITEQI